MIGFVSITLIVIIRNIGFILIVMAVLIRRVVGVMIILTTIRVARAILIIIHICSRAARIHNFVAVLLDRTVIGVSVLPFF